MAERKDVSPVPVLYFLATVLGAIGFYITEGWTGVVFTLAVSLGFAAFLAWMARI